MLGGLTRPWLVGLQAEELCRQMGGWYAYEHIGICPLIVCPLVAVDSPSTALWDFLL